MSEGRREKIKIRIPIGRIMNYLKENWGAPFIICFMVLLMVAALFLAEGVELVANEIAVYAYVRIECQYPFFSKLIPVY